MSTTLWERTITESQQMVLDAWPYEWTRAVDFRRDAVRAITGGFPATFDSYEMFVKVATLHQQIHTIAKALHEAGYLDRRGGEGTGQNLEYRRRTI